MTNHEISDTAVGEKQKRGREGGGGFCTFLADGAFRERNEEEEEKEEEEHTLRGCRKYPTLNGIYRIVLHTRFANKLIHYYNRDLAFSFIHGASRMREFLDGSKEVDPSWKKTRCNFKS